MSADDKYTHPGSGGVLVNKLDLHDSDALDEALNDYATANWAWLLTQPLPDVFDIAHLRTVHRELFSKVLPFAGEIRDVDTVAGGTGIAYCRPEFIVGMAADIDRGLQQDGYLRGLPTREFADRLGYHWGEITALHPMRDGNTRSQSAFVTQLAAAAGYSIEWKQVDVDELRELRLGAVVGSSQPLANYLHDRIVSFEVKDLALTAQALEGLTFQKSAQLDPELQRIVDVNKHNFPTSAAEIGRPTQGSTTEGRSYRPPQQGLSADHGYGR